MGLGDGPLFVGTNLGQGDGEIYQLQTGGLVSVHLESPGAPFDSITFSDGVLWSADGNVYLVGNHYDSAFGGWHGKIWKWDGTTLTLDQTFTIPPAFGADYGCPTITEYKGALYVARHNNPGGLIVSPPGSVVYKKTTPDGAWNLVLDLSTTNANGAKCLRVDNGYLLCIEEGAPGSPFFNKIYYTTVGDLGTWSFDTPGKPGWDPSYLFWDSVNSVWQYGEYDLFSASTDRYSVPALGGGWVGPANVLEGPTAGEVGDKSASSLWDLIHNNDPTGLEWNGVAWSPPLWLTLSSAAIIAIDNSRGTIREWGGDFYTLMQRSDFFQTEYYKDSVAGAIPFPDPLFQGSAFIPVTVGPPVWDVIDIQPSDWSSAPFCDQDVEGTVTYGSDYMEIQGDLGFDTPSKYVLLFGGCRPAVPIDWDMQIDIELIKLPKLHNLNEARLLVIGAGESGDRLVGVSLSLQGIAHLSGYEENETNTYGELVPDSDVYLRDGDTITLKLTGLGSDPQGRAYIAIETPLGVYRKGFESFGSPGGPSSDFVLVEAVGKGGDPVIARLKGWRIRDHAFSADDSASIENTKPVAAAT